MQRTKEEDALISQVANARKKVEEAQKRLDEYRVANCGFEVGDVIVNSQGAELQVRRIEAQRWGTVWLYCGKKKKNGEFGNAIMAYDTGNVTLKT